MSLIRNLFLGLFISLLTISLFGCKSKTYKVKLELDSVIELEVKKNELFSLLPYYKEIEKTTKNVEHFSSSFANYEIYNKETPDTCVTYNYELVIYNQFKSNEVVLEDNFIVSEDMTITPVTTVLQESFKVDYYYQINPKVLVDLISLNSFDDALPILNTENFTFLGWYLEDNVTEVKELDFSKQKNYSLYAKWEPTTSGNDVISNYYNKELEKYLEATMSNKEEMENLLFSTIKYASKLEEDIYNAFLNRLDKISKEDIQTVKDELERILKEKKDLFNLNHFEILEEVFEIINELSDEDKSLITEDLLYLECVEYYDDLKLIYDTYKEQSKMLDDALVRIPTGVSYLTYKKVLEISHVIEETPILFNLLTLSDKYTRLLIEAKKENEKGIHYSFGDENYYASKDLLGQAFFTDFYYFILYIGHRKDLEENKITSLNTFLYLASHMDAGGTTNLRGIGNIAGAYYLKKDINGILENQPETHFIGFCYQNNIYKDFIIMLYNFFGYWRIDEGYANNTNYGADLFAEAWAPTVDTAKFFYYTKETCYVKSQRMQDLYDETPQVYYGFNDSPTSSVTIRGKICAGFEKDVNTPSTYRLRINNDSLKKAEDTAQRMILYIYNLTTQKAVVNEITVEKIYIMYQNLDEVTKEKVENYTILRDLYNRYCV